MPANVGPLRLKGMKRILCGVMLWLRGIAAEDAAVDLSARYPTTLTEGDARPERARDWNFTTNDIFRLTSFHWGTGRERGVGIDVGEAGLGIGHGVDGAIWALVRPLQPGTLRHGDAATPEPLRHVWLRFHPTQLTKMFPVATVRAPGPTKLEGELKAIARSKMPASWQAGGRGMIPEPKDLVIDADVEVDGGRRRFFVVDQGAGTVELVAAFARRPVPLPPPLNATAAAKAFDQVWEAFDREYPMFGLRPEVDWPAARDAWRPSALAAESAFEFAAICAAMLRPLRDLHVGVEVAGTQVPVFERERRANANPAATARLLGVGLQAAGPAVKWAVTPDGLGYLAIGAWSQDAIPRQVDEGLERMRETRGLIVDVRLNGGGNEMLARQVAGRFVANESVYGFNQYRNGPAHTNFTERIARTVAPRGPWRYERPVVLLIGPRVMSSSESFVAMMTGATNVTTMGEPSAGSSGNPRRLELAVGVVVNLPRWIDYQPDGTPLDERGVTPQIRFSAGPEAFAGERDDLLAAARDRLRRSDGNESRQPR